MNSTYLGRIQLDTWRDIIDMGLNVLRDMVSFVLSAQDSQAALIAKIMASLGLRAVSLCGGAAFDARLLIRGSFCEGYPRLPETNAES